MHTVTKILVIFAAILCVLLAALTMSYSANADKIVSALRDEQMRRVAAETNASAQVSAAKDELIAANQRIADTSNQVASLESKIRQLQSERSTLMVEKRGAESTRDGFVNQIDQLTATNKTQAVLIEKYRDEVTKLRDQELAFRKREIELNDRLNDLESQREVLEGSVRALQEQLAEARKQLETAGTVTSLNTAAGAREPFTPTFALTGRITKIQTDMATGKPLGTINIGSTNQVRENMKLAITRGDKFIANFVVRKVDLNWAQGEINYLSQSGVSAQEGDVVQSLASR